MAYDLCGKRVTVMGLGRFGGGLGVTEWLVSQGAKVTLTDLATAQDLAGHAAVLEPGIASGAIVTRFGGHDEADFTAADAVVASPAVPRPWENPYLVAAARAGVRVTTEICLLADRLPNRASVFGVTGSAGKSTTAAMLASAVRSHRGQKVFLGGNIGGSLLCALHAIGLDDVVVLELSSAMLYWLGRAQPHAEPWSPGVAVVTGFAPNHLDWHGDQCHYARSKRQVLRRLDAADAVVAPGPMRGWIGAAPPPHRAHRVYTTLQHEADLPELRIPGAHNRANAALAVEAAVLAGVGRGAAAAAVAAFSGLPHRLASLGADPGGRSWWNDSKCTTPEAAAIAIGALAEQNAKDGAADTGNRSRRIHLLCGGYDKGVSLKPMLDAAAGCGGVYAFGATADAIAQGLAGLGASAGVYTDLESAAAAAGSAADRGDAIVLSPGCASWDQFANYEERGDAFARVACAHGAAGEGEK